MVYLVPALMVLFASMLVPPVSAAEDDAVAAIFVYGRAAGWTTSGFAVGDGSYVVTSSDVVMEPGAAGLMKAVRDTIVASPYTGDAYPAKVIATDTKLQLALLKLPSAALPSAAIAKDDVVARAQMATLGQLLSGEEIGSRFPAQLIAFDVEKKPQKFTINNWRAKNACITEIRGLNYLFLSGVEPLEKAPKGALAARLGVGILGVYQNRLVVKAGRKPVIFYKVLPAPELKKFLVKAGVPADTLSAPVSVGPKSADADAAFQAMCRALSDSLTGAPESVESATAAVGIRPKNAVAHLLLGSALSRQEKLDEALKSIDAALEIDPKIPDGHLKRGTVLAALKKPVEAQQDLRKAMEDDPKDARPAAALADLLSAKDETLPEAVKLARDAVRLVPDDLSMRVLLARILKRNKDFDGATAELRAVLEREPTWGEVRVALAATYEAAGKPDLAEAEYRKLVDIEPGNPDAHLTLIEFLIIRGKNDDAHQAIEATRKINKMKPEAEAALKSLEARMEKQD